MRDRIYWAPCLLSRSSLCIVLTTLASSAAAQVVVLEGAEIASQEAWVSPSVFTPQNTSILLVGRDDFGTQDTLVDFPIILGEDVALLDVLLGLHKSAESGGTGLGSHTNRVYEIEAPWNETTVTHATRPSSSDTGIAYLSTTPVGDYDTVSVASVVRPWVNEAAPHYGLEVRGDGSVGNYRLTYVAEDADPLFLSEPILFFRYVNPPTTTAIPQSLTPVTVDADCGPSEYAGSMEVPWVGKASLAFFWVHHDVNYLYVCVEDAWETTLKNFSLQLDGNASGGAVPQTDDVRVRAVPFDGSIFVQRGLGTGAWTAHTVAGLSAAAGPTSGVAGTATAEFRIPLAAIGSTGAVGLSVHHDEGPLMRGWPLRTVSDEPNGWVRAELFVFADGFESGDTDRW